MELQNEAMDYLKLSAYAFVPGLIAAFVLGLLSSILAPVPFAMYFVLGIVALWAVASIPKEIDSFLGIVILTLFLLGIQGFAGWLLPSVPMLQWASISSVSGLLTTIVAAAVGGALVKKYV